MNASTPPSLQVTVPQRPVPRSTTGTPDRDDVPSFGDAMKHASTAPEAKKDASPHADAAPPQDKTQAQGAQTSVGSHHARSRGAKADAGDDTEDSAADTADAAAADVADVASTAAHAQNQTVTADTQPAVDTKANSSEQPAQPAADPANGQAIAAAMLALIQQSAAPAPAPTTTTGATPVTASNDGKSTIADDIGAAITASSKMAQALTGSLGGAVAGTVADAATGVIGKAMGLASDAVAGLLGHGAKTDADAAAQLPDPAQLATGQVSQAAAPVSAPAVLQSAQAVGTPAFANELGQQIAWMSHGDIKEASIRLHPEDMGQLDVKISVHENRVDVAFAAQHPAAVQAVNQTLTQLDTMLAHHGLQLGQAQVGQQKAGQGDQGHGKAFAQAAQGRGETGEDSDVQRTSVRAPHALVDDFA
jgi:flagellar hook-length control protein FliK